MMARIGKRGTVVIPASLRHELGLEAGTPVTAEAHEGGVLVRSIAVDLLTDRERNELLQAANQAYTALHSDPHAWAEEQAERAVWQSGVGAGLSPEAWTDDDFVPHE